MSTDVALQAAVQDFEKTVAHLKDEYGRLQAGRANPGLVEGLMIDAYGSMQPLKNVASISVPDPKSLHIQPWDRSLMSAIEKAIQVSDLGLNPNNNGTAIILNIPQLTEERRRDLVKLVNKFAEDARISIRNARQTANSAFKALSQSKQITEDQSTGAEKKLQEKVDEYNKKVAELAKAKEESLMTV